MNVLTSRGARFLVLVTVVASVAGCGLPRSGPNKREIFSGSVLKEGDAFVVTVNSRVTRARWSTSSPRTPPMDSPTPWTDSACSARIAANCAWGSPPAPM